MKFNVTLSAENLASIIAALSVIANTAAEEHDKFAYTTAMDALNALKEISIVE